MQKGMNAQMIIDQLEEMGQYSVSPYEIDVTPEMEALLEKFRLATQITQKSKETQE